MIEPVINKFGSFCWRCSVFLVFLLFMAACNRDPLPVQTVAPTAGIDEPAGTAVSPPATPAPAATPGVISTSDFLAIDAYLQEIDQDVCQQAYETRREIEALLAQGADVQELQAAVDELIAELQNCPPTLTPTP